MSDQVVIKKKEEVEAAMKREAQAMAEGKALDEIREVKFEIKKEEPAKAPPYITYLAIYDSANKLLESIENLERTTLRAGKIKSDLKNLTEKFFALSHEVDDDPEIHEMNSTLSGYGWMALCNKMQIKLFVLYPAKARKTAIRTFISETNGFIEKIGDEEKIKKDIKKLLTVFLERKAKKKTTDTKFDELKKKTDKINEKVAKQLGGMTTNFENVHRTEELAENLKTEAAKIKEQAEELADLTGGTSMMTIIMIVVGVLLLVAVFGNLYVQINQPPPKALKAGLGHFHHSRLFRVSRRILRGTWHLAKKLERSGARLVGRMEKMLEKRNKKVQMNNENKINSMAHQKAILKNIMHQKALKNRKKKKVQVKKKVDLAYSSVFRNEKLRNHHFTLNDYLTGKAITPLKRANVVHVSSFLGIGGNLNSKVGLLI